MSHLPQKCIARECTNLWVMEARYLFELKKLGKRIFEEIFWQLMKQDRTLLNNAVSLLKGHYGTLDDSLWKLRLLFKRLNSQKWHHVHKSSQKTYHHNPAHPALTSAQTPPQVQASPLLPIQHPCEKRRSVPKSKIKVFYSLFLPGAMLFFSSHMV